MPVHLYGRCVEMTAVRDGDGGATITATDEVAKNLRTLRYYGMAERYYVVHTPGHNCRLDEVQAEILRRKLRRLDRHIAGRSRSAMPKALPARI